jgi:hypothetical protein
MIIQAFKQETFLYTCNKTEKELQEALKKLFDKPLLDFSVNLTGDFRNEREFRISKQFTGVYSEGGSHTSLNGRLFTENNTTYIQLTTKPSPVIYLLVPFIFLFGVGVLISLIVHGYENWIGMSVMIFLYIFVIPFIILFYGQHAKTELLKMFTDYMHLKKCN